MTLINSKENNIDQSKEILIKNSLPSANNTEQLSPQEKAQFKARLSNQPQKDTLEMEGKYKDPLLTYPGRLLAYTNEVGVAIEPISPVLGKLLWVPALMYFGADIYDKYKKGEDGDYSKGSARKGVQQAVFQGLASCLLPIAAVHGGQDVAGHLMKKGKTNLTAKSQMEILDAIAENIEEGRITETTTKSQAQKRILDPIKNLFKMSDKGLTKKQKKSKFSNLGVSLKDTIRMDKDSAEKFMDKQVDDILEFRNKLLKEESFSKKSEQKLAKKFKGLVKKYGDDAPGKEKALRETLQKFAQNKKFKPNMVKTLGGFVGLILLAMPIDYVVENIIIKKAVEPGLKRVEEEANHNPSFLGGLFFKGDKNK